MKNLRLFTLMVVFLVSIAGAMASFDAPDAKLGGENQNRAETVQTTIDITNLADSDISGLTFELIGVSDDYEVSLTPSADSIAQGQVISLVIEGYVPLDLDAVDTRGRKIAPEIGDIAINGVYENGTAVPEKRITLSMEAENLLEFGSGDITIGDSSSSLRDGKTYDEVRRNDEVSLEIVIENKFNDDGECDEDGGDCDIDDITVYIESSDSDLDVDDDFDFDSIRADDEDTETFSFDIPDDLDEDDYDVDMWVVGEDENGARHGERLTFTLEVEVPRDEITIRSFYLTPDTLSCDARSTTLTVTLKNTGRNDQDDVSIEIISAKLGISEGVYTISLDEEDSTTKTFNLRLPSDVEPGTYYVQIIANVDHDEETDRQAAILTVRECTDSDNGSDDDSDAGDEDPSDDSNTDVNIIEIPPTAGVIYGEKQNTNFMDSTEFLILLGGMFLIALILLLLLVVVLLKK